MSVHHTLQKTHLDTSEINRLAVFGDSKGLGGKLVVQDGTILQDFDGLLTIVSDSGSELEIVNGANAPSRSSDGHD